ncbi:MAG: SIS domain-containing protein [Christensenellales bacterium]|jgi:uncharacterized phosphosugar-binding protein
MDAIKAYLDNIRRILDDVEREEKSALHEGALLMRDAVLGGHNLFAFGCSHAGLLALELYYRTGGMAVINPIKAPGLNLDVDPATMTSQIERLGEYGNIIVDHQPIGRGDVVIIHSVSGRNTVTVDVALRAREKGAKIIALTSMAYSKSVSSRHPSGKRLFEVADVVLDNHGCIGDGSIEIPPLAEKVGPTSTAVGAAMLNAMMTQAVSLIVEAGSTAPIFMSANVEGGDEHNKAMLAQYRDRIFYMGHA